MPRRPLIAVATTGGIAVLSPVLLADGWVSFIDETDSRLVAPASLGVNDPEEKDFAYADLDQDGDIDLVVVRKQPFTNPTGKRNLLLMNENGVLTDRTNAYATAADDGGNGFLDITNDRDVSIADVNGDGWLDVVTCPALNQNLAKSISHPRVYINLGNDGDGDWLGLFYEEARIPQLAQAPNGCGLAVGDLTGDDFPEIYVVDYNSNQEDRLLINDGTGFFTDETSLRMTQTMISSGFGTSGEIVDLNNDGRNDICKSENGPFKATYNDSSNEGFFDSHETASSGAHYGMSAGELNNDGQIDIVLGDDGADRFLLNLGPGPDGMANWESKTFSFQSGGDDGFGNNSRIVDLNNDGWNDVLISDVDVDIGGCGRRLHIYRNLGNAPSVTLQEQGTGGIPTSQMTGTHDAAVFDINGDGWNDMVLGRCAGLSVWMNEPPTGLVYSYPEGLPAFIEPDFPHPFTVQLSPVGGAEIVEESVMLAIEIEGQGMVKVPMTPLGGNLFEGELPAVACTTTVAYSISAELDTGQVISDPTNAPDSMYEALAANGIEVAIRDELEKDVSGWTIESGADLLFGAWEQAEPNGTVAAGMQIAPDADATAGDGVLAFVTLNGAPGQPATQTDVDGGPAHLISPNLDLDGIDAFISFAAWFVCDDAGTDQADILQVSVSNDAGVNWTPVFAIEDTSEQWQVHTFRVSSYVAPTETVQVRFTTADIPNNSITEAGIDNLEVQVVLCPDACSGDLDGDGQVSGADLGTLLAAWGSDDPESDLSGNGVVDGADLGTLLANWGPCSTP